LSTSERQVQPSAQTVQWVKIDFAEINPLWKGHATTLKLLDDPVKRPMEGCLAGFQDGVIASRKSGQKPSKQRFR
jgi:hypothetical protein